MKETFYCVSCAVRWNDSYSLFQIYQSACPRCGELCDAMIDQALEYAEAFDDEPGNLTDSRDLSAVESDEDTDSDADADSDSDAEGGGDSSGDK